MQQVGPGRRSTRNQRLRAARRRGSRVKVLARKNCKAVKLYTTGIWSSIAYGVEQYGLSPTDLKQFRATAAACSGVGGYQHCPVTAIEIGMGQHPNPAVQARLCIFSWRFCLWDENSDMHQTVQKAWRRVHSRLRGAKKPTESRARTHVECNCDSDGFGLDPLRA